MDEYRFVLILTDAHCVPIIWCVERIVDFVSFAACFNVVIENEEALARILIEFIVIPVTWWVTVVLILGIKLMAMTMTMTMGVVVVTVMTVLMRFQVR